MDNGKGKGALIADGVAERAREVEEQARRMALVVFACRHVVHRVCLESEIAVKVAAAEEEGEGDGNAEEEEERVGYACPVCHGD